jgi:hypothetical protein
MDKRGKRRAGMREEGGGRREEGGGRDKMFINIVKILFSKECLNYQNQLKP